MFWTDWGEFPRIERAGMDGDPSTRTTLVDSGVRWPNGLTLDLDGKRLYWVEAQLREVASVDWEGRGRRRLDLERNALQQPFAVAFFNQMLYWTDFKTK